MPVVSITGPRQSGKTILAQQLFPHYRYINLEHLEQRAFAQNDPAGFIRSCSGGVEIKSGCTLHEEFFKNLHFFHKISGNPPQYGWVIYGGSQQQSRSYGNVAGWDQMPIWIDSA